MEHQADVHPQLRLILPDAGPGCEKNGRRATWPVTTRSGRHQVPVAVLPTAKSLSAFSLKPQSDRLLAYHYAEAGLAAQAIPQWQRAAQLSVGRAAHREAISQFNAALDLLAGLPQGLNGPARSLRYIWASVRR